MRKIFIGLLMAATAATPALADKGEKRGRGGDKHVGKHFDKHERQSRGGWERHARFDRPAHVVRIADRDWDDDDRDDRKHARKAWKREYKEERRFERQAVRADRRYVPVERVVRYAPVRYVERNYDERVVRYLQPRQSYYLTGYGSGYGQDWSSGYQSTSYSPLSNSGFGQNLFGANQ